MRAHRGGRQCHSDRSVRQAPIKKLNTPQSFVTHMRPYLAQSFTVTPIPPRSEVGCRKEYLSRAALMWRSTPFTVYLRLCAPGRLHEVMCRTEPAIVFRIERNCETVLLAPCGVVRSSL